MTSPDTLFLDCLIIFCFFLAAVGIVTEFRAVDRQRRGEMLPDVEPIYTQDDEARYATGHAPDVEPEREHEHGRGRITAAGPILD